MCTACEYLMLKSLGTNIRSEDIVAKTDSHLRIGYICLIIIIGTKSSAL